MSLERLDTYSLTLDDLDVTYGESNLEAHGQPLDYTTTGNDAELRTMRGNEPLSTGGTNAYRFGTV